MDRTTERRSYIGTRYQVEAVLGRGGMGAVCRVHDERTGKRLALKQLDVDPASNTQELRTTLFQHEYHVLTQLAHPNVVHVFDYGVDDGVPFYTMELLEGDDLHKLSPMAWQRCCEVLLELCSALSVLHARGLVHRDVTPRNVLVSSEGVCTLIDFGAMAHMGPCRGTVGTPPYMAPELLQRQWVDGRSDIFALGALAYFMLCGRHAFPAPSTRELPAYWQNVPLPAAELVPDIPRALDQLVMSMLSVEPEARPVQIAEVTQRVSALLGRPASDNSDGVQAHLTTPKLVGRDKLLSLLRAQLKRATGGHGATMLVCAEPGMGRSRLLEAFALEAKLAGFLVLSAHGHKRQEEEFAVIGRLLEVLALAAAARAEAAVRGLEPALVGLWPPDALDEPLPTRSADMRIECQNALVTLFERVSEFIPLALVVDDVELADPSSQQVLGRLAGVARTRRLLVLTSAPQRAADENPALSHLRAQAEHVPLEGLSEEQTEALLASVFGHSAELRRVSEWVYRVSEGRPRTSMQLAAHLVDRGFVKFYGGRFELPAALDALELPQSLEQATRARLAALTPTGRVVAELLASATRFLPLTVSEIIRLLSKRIRDAEVFSALDELFQAQVIRPEGDGYAFADDHLVSLIREDMSEHSSRDHHRALGELYRARGPDHHCLAAYHFYRAGMLAEAHPLMTALGGLVVDSSSLTSVIARSAEGIELYEQMLRYSENAGYSPAVVYRFRKVMLQLAAVSRPELTSYAPATMAQLRFDIGLDRWEELAETENSFQRLTRCLELGKARFADLPEEQRGLETGKAIKEIATCSALLVGAYAANMDTAALDAVAPQLEPLRVLLPVLDIVYLLAKTAADSSVRGCRQTATREHIIELLNEPVAGMDELTRQGAYALSCYYLGLEHALVGSDAALSLAAVAEEQTVYAVLGKQVRVLHALSQGSQGAAQHFRQERDLLRALGVNCENHLQLAIRWESVALYRTCDLLGLARLAREIEPRARRFSGLQPRLHAIRAQYHLLCDEPEAALVEIVQGERLAPPLAHGAWRELALLRIDALLSLDRVEEALAQSETAERHLQDAGDSFLNDDRMAVCQARALSRLGRGEQARARLHPLIERLRDFAPAGAALGELYEALAIVELEQGDQDAFGEACAQVQRIYKRERHPGLSARYARLLSLAHKWATPASMHPGVTSEPGEVFSSEVLAGQFQTHLAGFGEQEQLRQLLRLVLEETQLSAGYLYRVSKNGTLTMLAQHSCVAPNPVLDARLRELVCAGRIDSCAETTALTGAREAAPTVVVDAMQHEYVPVMLITEGRHARVIGILALRATQMPALSYAFLRAVTRTVHTLTSS